MIKNLIIILNFKFQIAILAIALYFFPAIASAAVLQKPSNNLGLVGYWSFNEGTSTIATDFSGNGNNGSLQTFADPATATSGWGNGKRGKALNFDGSSDYVRVADNASLNVSTSFTISVWVKRASFNQWMVLYESGNQANQWALQFGDTNLVDLVEIGILDNYNNTAIVDKNWHHIAVVKNGDGASNVTFYLDGVSDGTASVGSVTVPSGTKYIGAWETPSDYFAGTLDEVRLYNRALSQSEIVALYKTGTVTHKVPNNLGLVGYWSFNEGTSTIATDFSGNGNNGTTTNVADPPTSNSGWASGKFGRALNFDGSNDYVGIGSPASLDLSGSATFCAWIYARSVPNASESEIISNFHPTTGSSQYSFEVEADKSIGLFWGTGPYGSLLTGANAITFNNWYHVCAVRNSSSAGTVYVNGVAQSTSVTSAAIPASATANTQIGRQGTGSYFDGKIDDVRVYNRALSADEVAGLYQGSKAVFANVSPVNRLTNGLVGYWTFDGKNTDWGKNITYDILNSNNGTMTNMSTTTSPAIGKIGQALSFDGSDDYVHLKSDYIITTQDWTVSSWVNAENFTNYEVSVANGDNSGAGKSGLQLGVTNASKGFVASMVGTDSEEQADTLTTLSPNTWYHIVGVKEGTALKIYLNGVLDNSIVLSTATMDYTGTTVGTRIGINSENGDPLIGRIDEVRLYNRALSASEVKQLYLMGK